MRLNDWMWITCLSGLTACGGSPSDDAGVDGGTDAGGVWQRCNEWDRSIPGVQSRGSGSSLECFCEVGRSCNYGWSVDVGVIGREDAAIDSGADAGFADAPPMDDVAIDALVLDDRGSMDAPMSNDDASL